MMDPKLSNICVQESATLKSALQCLQKNEHKFCVVIDEHECIKGTITDGDCRRSLLNGSTLDTLVTSVMSQKFIVVDESFSLDQIKLLMKSNGIDQVPIVDSNRKFKDVVSIRSLNKYDKLHTNPVVILAGGKGTRLRPLTENMPKPMLAVNGRPMLERLINNLVSTGYSDIYISVNYYGHIIEEYFGNGENFGCNIRYLRENLELGTGGPLRLIKHEYSEPIVVLNGDLVTEVDFATFLDFHNRHDFEITVGISNYTIEVPFGVINLAESGQVVAIKEKPQTSFNINAGLYIIDPSLTKCIPENEFYPITSLIEKAILDGKRVGAFPIHESWRDVGVLKQYFAAQEI